MDMMAYLLSRSYTDGSIEGTAGVLKGKNCTIQSIEPTEDGNIVTFKWTADDGSFRTQQMTVKNGISVADTHMDGTSLIITLSDGTEINAGTIVSTSSILAPIKATVQIGSVTAGKTYAAGTMVETILRDILIKTENPVANLSITPDRTLYDIVTESIDSISMKAVLIKKTLPIKTLKYYVDNLLVHQLNGVADGGVFTYQYDAPTPINTTTVFKIEAEDNEGNKGTNSITVNFVAKSYYGVVGADIGAPTSSQIKAMNNTLKTGKGYVYNNITCEYNKVCYAYPKSMGALSSIKDIPNNINYTNSFSRTELNIDGIDYYCYTQTDPSGADGIQLTFA